MGRVCMGGVVQCLFFVVQAACTFWVVNLPVFKKKKSKNQKKCLASLPTFSRLSRIFPPTSVPSFRSFLVRPGVSLLCFCRGVHHRCRRLGNRFFVLFLSRFPFSHAVQSEIVLFVVRPSLSRLHLSPHSVHSFWPLAGR
jgi:hypothetical protein